MGRINIIKIYILPKAIYRFSAIRIKITIAYFTDLDQIFQKFIWDQKNPQIASAILRKKNKVGEITIPDISYSYQDRVVLPCRQTYRPVEYSRESRNKPLRT